MQAFENMNMKTKIILSIVGLSAVVVPTLLLIFVSRGPEEIPQVDTSSRQIDPGNIERLKKNAVESPLPVAIPTPSPVIPTPTPAINLEGQATPAAR